MPTSSEQTTSKPSTLAKKLEKLARIIPGIGGYQDRERMRESDKQVRLFLAEKIEVIKKAIEQIKKHLTEKKNLNLLPYLDQFTRELDRMRDTLKYAPYGYKGIFDLKQVDLEALNKIYSFDLFLLEQLEEFYTEAMEFKKQGGNEKMMREGLQTLEERRENFEEILFQRNNTTHLLNKEEKA